MINTRKAVRVILAVVMFAISNMAFSSYSFWKVHGTSSLADAIYKKNEPGIKYWIAKINQKNIDNLCSVDNGISVPLIGPIKMYKIEPHRVTALEAAIVCNRVDLMQRLLSHGADPNKMSDFVGRDLQPFIKQNPAVLNTLLSHGLNPNKKYNCLFLEDQEGRPTAVFFDVPLLVRYVFNQSKSEIMTLLQHGAELDEDSSYDTGRGVKYFNQEQKDLLAEAKKEAKRNHLAKLAGGEIVSKL
jgi:hypothetical protein